MKKVGQLYVKSRLPFRSKLRRAAALFWNVYWAYQGRDDNIFALAQAKKDVVKSLKKMLFASILMQGMNIHQGDVLQYLMDNIKLILNNPGTLLILDPPYIKSLLSMMKQCSKECAKDNTYTNEYTYSDIEALINLTRNAKCKIIFFHSEDREVEDLLIGAGYRKNFEYNPNAGKNPNRPNPNYNTVVYTKNISKDEVFVDENCGWINVMK